MMSVLSAETSKLLRHRGTWALVWIFPLGFTLVFIIGQLVRLNHASPPNHMPPPNAQAWIVNTTNMWKAAMSGPGRYVIGAFTALAIGGEYGWNTWKLVVPHQRRLLLIGAKFGVVFGLLMIAWVIGAGLGVAFGFIEPALRGLSAPEGIVFGALLQAHGRAAAATVLSTLLTMGYGAAGAVVLRSTLGGAIVAIAAVTGERLAGLFAPLVDPWLFLALPPYPLSNLESWILKGVPASQLLSSGITQMPWATSLVVFAAWTVGLFALATAVFHRQDLN